jgi:hypothetical protein
MVSVSWPGNFPGGQGWDLLPQTRATGQAHQPTPWVAGAEVWEEWPVLGMPVAQSSPAYTQDSGLKA